MDGKPPADAGDMGLIPGPGRSHVPQSNEAGAPQLLSPHSRAHRPQLPSLCADSPCSETRETTAVRSTRSALQKAQEKQQRPSAFKNK